jgi:hypothetical protein
MSEHDDILERLRQTLNEQGIDSFHILEDLVPLDIQMDYFKYFDILRKEKQTFDREKEAAILFSKYEDIERKKKSLTLLATIPDVGAYRTIETYHNNNSNTELSHWSSMALVSSRIVLTSDLSGQQQVYISSGLGGQDKKLRFFSLFTTNNRQEFSELQKEIIDREFTFHLKTADVYIEKFDIKNNYFTILLLFPFDEDIRSRLNSAVEECNQYGNFLNTKFLFTNIKILNEKEIGTLLNKK